MMTLFPWPNRMTSPGGSKTSVERFARNDLVLRFFDFKRSKQKNGSLQRRLLTRWKKTTTGVFTFENPLLASKFCATFASVTKRR